MYTVLQNQKVSHDSHILRVGLPEGRDILGLDPLLPTCISVTYEHGTDEQGNPKPLAKSYSPISHPSTRDYFDLLVKAYPPRPGGGVGAFLCGLTAGDTFPGKLKKERTMHGRASVLGRWKQVGLVAGGTGIAPLFQIMTLLLKNDTNQIRVLSINHSVEDILMKKELDDLAEQYKDRLTVTYSLTRDRPSPESAMEAGRGSVEMVKRALPDPSADDVMIMVCGRDEFVDFWGGPVGRAPPLPDGSKGPKIQGPLLGLLKESGFDAAQVFKY